LIVAQTIFRALTRQFTMAGMNAQAEATVEVKLAA
jgi:hypothetical protein